jgi:hypothetical protein
MGESFDPLYQIFDKHLRSGAYDSLAEQDLIDAVVHEYLLFLVGQGLAPHARAEVLSEDIAVEVRDMLKMKTYGHFSVRHYNLANKKSG